MKKEMDKICLSLMIAMLFCTASSTIFAETYHNGTSMLWSSSTLSFDEIMATGNAIVTNEY